MATKKISLNVLDFTEYPGPRYISQGENSGEAYYEKVLKSEFAKIHDEKDKDWVIAVNLDGTAGYASSFIDEAFGNLAYDYGREFILKHLEIISTDEPDWINVITEETIPEWDSKKKKGIPRKPNLTSE